MDNLIQEFWSIENDGTRKEDNTITEDEKSAIRILESTINHTGESYEIGLPCKVPANLQNNYFSALNQLNILNKRLNNDPKLSDMYQQTLVTDLEKNYVKPVEMTDPNPERIWYLPHHPVQSANKPNKVGRVANAASKFKGESLYFNLVTGPDLLNSLIGILVRFREKPIAILADIEGMLMQIGIRNEDQSALGFLWSIYNDVRQFQFTRLIFGATCTPSCAIFALNRCAEDNVETYPKAQSAIKSYFYMNDYIQSFDSPENADATAFEVKNCLRAGGFGVTKFLSNHQQALQCITPEDLEEPKSETRFLGQKWNLEKDTYFMKSHGGFPKEAEQYTQRKLFSLVSSIYDPIGFLGPMTIKFKILLQQLWQLGRKWDEPLPIELLHPLQKLLKSYHSMPQLEIPRQMTTQNLLETENQLHVFVDALIAATCAVDYLRSLNKTSNEVQNAFVIGKCKVAPVKQLSVPKLELEASVTGLRLLNFVRHELSVEISNVFYWTDSQVVRDWIGSSKKQPVFVANSIVEIKVKSKPDDWNHLATNLNPADHGTRGLEPKEIEAKWFKPPDFLSTNDVFCRPTKQMPICAATTRSALRTKTPVLDPKQFSTWTKILLTIATVFNLIYRAKKQRDNHHQYTVEDIELSKSYLIQMSQVNSFPTVIELLKVAVNWTQNSNTGR